MRVQTAIAVLSVAGSVLQGCTTATDRGRGGNKQFARDEFEAAAASYQEGIDRFESAEPDKVLSDLLNNKGAAHYRADNPEPARDAFIRSVAAATDVRDQARGSFNAGNSAFAAGEKQVAADFFRQALFLEPGNADAKFNYEFVKRQLEQEQQDQQDGNQPPPTPSDYAKELKARADELVARHRYRDAHELMMDGLKIDPTVRAFQTFIDRTAAVADIDGGQSAPSP